MSCPVIPVSKIPDSEELAEKLRALNLGMTPTEARQVASILGHDPSIVELFIFDIEWSEHCSYKSSRNVLKKYLPGTAPNVILGPGEDAGIIHFTRAAGRSFALVMAHESHNHPSQVLPVEGAATGIGGIVRDVDCMGATVCAVADSLRFGDPNGKNPAATRWVANGVVDGIRQYGNALGVPNLAGDIYFDSSFDDNCLVNVISLGIVEESRIIHSRVPSEAAREDYDLILVGKPTDPSGFGGVTFASEILDDAKDTQHVGAVQIHDPFLKNILITRKANLMVLDLAESLDVSIGMKDLGGGGLACASSELCQAGGFGAEIFLDTVHTAAPDLPPEVIACSETQERFLYAVPREFTPRVLEIFNEIWNLPGEANGARATVIGHTTTEPVYRLWFRDEQVCNAPIDQITSGICYTRESRPVRTKHIPESYQAAETFDAYLVQLLQSINICSRHPVYQHYDTEVQGAAVLRPGEADAGIIAPLELECISSAGIALSVDGNPFVGDIDPYWGGATAVAEAMRNVIAVGAIPRALTDCLNYGNPEDPQAFFQFEQGVKGIGDAAGNFPQLDSQNRHPVPVISGNVSFYNESASGAAVKPSPIVACVGILDDFSRAVTCHFKKPGNHILLVGKRRDELGGSAYLRTIHSLKGASPLTIDWVQEYSDMLAVYHILRNNLAMACHDISDGGFLTALAEMLMHRRKKTDIGATIKIHNPLIPPDRFLFCETGGFILEIPSEHLQRALEIAASENAWVVECGLTDQSGTLTVIIDDVQRVHSPVAKLRTAWLNGLEEIIS